MLCAAGNSTDCSDARLTCQESSPAPPPPHTHIPYCHLSRTQSPALPRSVSSHLQLPLPGDAIPPSGAGKLRFIPKPTSNNQFCKNQGHGNAGHWSRRTALCEHLCPSAWLQPVQLHVCFPCWHQSGECRIRSAPCLFLRPLHSGLHPDFPVATQPPPPLVVGLEPGAEPSQLRGASPALTGRARTGAGCPGSSSSAGPNGSPIARAAAAMAQAALPGSECAPGQTGGCPGLGRDAPDLGGSDRAAPRPAAGRSRWAQHARRGGPAPRQLPTLCASQSSPPERWRRLHSCHSGFSRTAEGATSLWSSLLALKRNREPRARRALPETLAASGRRCGDAGERAVGEKATSGNPFPALLFPLTTLLLSCTALVGWMLV